MSKSIKTPALNDVEFAKNNTEVALRTFVSVINGIQYVVEAETVKEAQLLITREAKLKLGDEQPQIESLPENVVNINSNAENNI